MSHNEKKYLRILIIDDEPEQTIEAKLVFEELKHHVTVVRSGILALGECASQEFDVAYVDYRMPGMNGIETGKRLREQRPGIVLFIFSLYQDETYVLDALNAGFDDYLIKKPFSEFDIKISLLKAQRIANEKRIAEERRRLAEDNARLNKELSSRCRPQNMIGDSAEMRKIYELISLVSQQESTILVRGESGTGKELVASAIHYSSNRKNGKIVKVNCAALAETILESEMFGHEKGAFTGAATRRIGRFEEANGGTIFLDEIGDFSASSQIRLLRVLQEREIERVGSNATQKIDVRVICATNRNLEELVKTGKFRQDLYYRINVIELTVPPLRARSSDIPLLVEHFVKKHTKQTKCPVTVSDGAMKTMSAYQWPGNVRELENCIERGITLCRDGVIDVQQLPPKILTHQDATVYSIDPHLEIEIKKRLDVIAQLVKEGRPKISGPIIDERMGNGTGAFKAYCHDNGAEMELFILANITEYRAIIPTLKRLSPRNFSNIPLSD